MALKETSFSLSFVRSNLLQQENVSGEICHCLWQFGKLLNMLCAIVNVN